MVDSNSALDFFSTPDRYLHNNRSIQIRSQYLLDRLAGQREVAILDVGCGDGSLSLPLLPQARRLVCIDFSEPMLNLLRGRLPPDLADRVELRHQDIDGLATDERFEVVLCVGVLAHVPSIEKVWQLLCDCLQPGGTLFVQYTDADAVESRLKGIRGGHDQSTNHITSPMVRGWAGEYGLQVDDDFSYSDTALGMSGRPGAFTQAFLSRQRWFCSEHIVALTRA